MNAQLLLSLSLLAAPLASQRSLDQKPAPTPPPQLDCELKPPPPPPPVKTAVPSHAAAPVSAEARPEPKPTTNPRLPVDAVLVDQPGDGATWVRTRGYKACFDGRGTCFVPFLGSDAPRNFPLTMTLRSVRVGGQDVAFAAKTEPALGDRRVTLNRGSVVEQYELAPTGIEQSFVFATLPQGGDLVVRIDLDSELAPVAAKDGLRFGNDLGGVDYGAAFVLDQSRVKVPVASRLDGQAIELRVPASYLATAAFPVTIDPIVSPFTARSEVGVVEFAPDIAYDQSAGEYLVVWEEAFSATDHDVGTVFMSATGTLVPNSVVYADATTINWTHPRVASLVQHHLFLTVGARGAAPGRSIWGRVRAAGSNLAPAQFQISSSVAVGDKLNPDVGGDPNSGRVYWNVVWQRNVTSSDSDIHAQLVDPTGTLFGGTVLVDNSSATLDSNPSISKSDGAAPASSQGWNIVWQRLYGPGDNDIYFAQVRWDGTLTTTSTGLDTSAADDTYPTASSPADERGGGQRYWVACYQRNMGGERDIMARLVLANAASTVTNLSALDSGYQARDQVTPHVDCDGWRFVVAWSEKLSATDWDIRGGTYHMVYGNALGLTERRVVFSAATTTIEGNPRVVANRTGGGSRARYGLTWDRQISSTDTDVEGAVYDGLGTGGFVVVNSGCNGLGMVTGGLPALGETVQFLMTGTGGNVPMMIFSLPAPAVSLCPGCSLTVALGPAIFFSGASLNLPIPPEGAFVGGTFAVQGFTYGTGPCLNAVALSDTAQCTIQ